MAPISRRTVRIVGSDDAWDVLAETPRSMLLVNPSARHREEIALLEAQLAQAREQLAARQAEDARS